MHAETCMINGVYILLRSRPSQYRGLPPNRSLNRHILVLQHKEDSQTPSDVLTDGDHISALTVQRLMMLVHAECVKQCVIRVAAMTYGCNTRLSPKQRASELYFAKMSARDHG